MSTFPVTIVGRIPQAQVKAVADAIVSGAPEMDAARQQMAVAYADFVRRRYNKASRGDGTWADLSYGAKLARARALRPRSGTESIAQRETTRRKQFDRKVKRLQKQNQIGSRTAKALALATQKFSILRDTGTMFNSLALGGSGNVNIKADNVSVKYGSNIRYFKAHNEGLNGLPKREILVPPDAATERRMSNFFTENLAKLFKRVNG